MTAISFLVAACGFDEGAQEKAEVAAEQAIEETGVNAADIDVSASSMRIGIPCSL